MGNIISYIIGTIGIIITIAIAIIIHRKQKKEFKFELAKKNNEMNDKYIDDFLNKIIDYSISSIFTIKENISKTKILYFFLGYNRLYDLFKFILKKNNLNNSKKYLLSEYIFKNNKWERKKEITNENDFFNSKFVGFEFPYRFFNSKEKKVLNIIISRIEYHKKFKGINRDSCLDGAFFVNRIAKTSSDIRFLSVCQGSFWLFEEGKIEEILNNNNIIVIGSPIINPLSAYLGQHSAIEFEMNKLNPEILKIKKINEEINLDKFGKTSTNHPMYSDLGIISIMKSPFSKRNLILSIQSAHSLAERICIELCIDTYYLFKILREQIKENKWDFSLSELQEKDISAFINNIETIIFIIKEFDDDGMRLKSYFPGILYPLDLLELRKRITLIFIKSCEIRKVYNYKGYYFHNTIYNQIINKND